jgi:hypothetical protein
MLRLLGRCARFYARRRNLIEPSSEDGYPIFVRWKSHGPQHVLICIARAKLLFDTCKYQSARVLEIHVTSIDSQMKLSAWDRRFAVFAAAANDKPAVFGETSTGVKSCPKKNEVKRLIAVSSSVFLDSLWAFY